MMIDFEKMMIDLEEKYERFDDYGLVVGLTIAITMLGCLFKVGFEDLTTVIYFVRIGYYALLGLNLLFGLLLCYCEEAPGGGLEKRSKLENSIATFIFIGANVAGAVCFELITPG
ncbi:hypothetical protein FYZ48_25555 [Gimesia chilikensis]|uniref:hypothetical protein n=1 Tax=Gimesia chilikensis TaxID=2605989 RepID=UPI0011F019F4|nr:hypothetical protein [Gimesia chilikensis]KAA0131513.1 hypothetical protein FYZ48_25555 [Gimesia chilikensis]